MRREYFTLQVRGLDEGPDPVMPTLSILYEGPQQPLVDRFLHGGGPISATDIDVSYRLQAPLEDPDATGVLSLSNRITGEYLAEIDVTAEMMVSFLRAARQYGQTVPDTADRFRVNIDIDDGPSRTFESRILLVYHEDGSLLRRHSLIPSGVEL